jgi:hypothetical protein
LEKAQKQLSVAEAEFVKTQHSKLENGEIYDGKTWKKWIFRKFCHWSRIFGIFFYNFPDALLFSILKIFMLRKFWRQQLVLIRIILA